MEEENQPQPWSFKRKLSHAIFWAVVIYAIWYGSAKLAYWATGTG